MQARMQAGGVDDLNVVSALVNHAVCSINHPPGVEAFHCCGQVCGQQLQRTRTEQGPQLAREIQAHTRQ
jgi:hypothetical protein